jgi:hypothetical protein
MSILAEYYWKGFDGTGRAPEKNTAIYAAWAAGRDAAASLELKKKGKIRCQP